MLEILIDFYTFCEGLQENTQNVCDYHEIEKNEQRIKDRRSWKSVQQVRFFAFMCVVLGLNEEHAIFPQFTPWPSQNIRLCSK